MPRWLAPRSRASKAASSMPSASTNRPSARPAPTALSTMRRSPTNWPRASTRRAVSRRSRMRICGTPGTAICVGEPMARCGNSIELYPHLREEEPRPGPTSTIGAPVEHLDLATVIKVSQAVSGEIVLEKLIDTLMRTAIEHAGAERGLLILPRGAEQRIEAEATTSGDTVVVHLRDEHRGRGRAAGVDPPLCRAHAGERDSRRCRSREPVFCGSLHPSAAAPVPFSACR